LGVPRSFLIDPSLYDLDRPVADIEEIRRYNRQRFEMEQLTAIVYEDSQQCICVGYKDIGPDDFWVRGHIPGMPLMPGVIMCEAAAQVASYTTQKFKLMKADLIGFGGLKDVRFRGIVQPGDRFVIACKLLKVRSMLLSCEFQCMVRDNIVCEGILMGVPLNEELVKGRPG
jgi:3-hydroxyacyl-[acyl-carrier-protein] dehydratase